MSQRESVILSEAKDLQFTPPSVRSPGRFRTIIQVALVAVIVAFGAHASDTSNGARYQKLGHAIMCPCGCNQLLGECNHVGCPDSDKMRSQLIASINHGDDDTTIFHAFQENTARPRWLLRCSRGSTNFPGGFRPSCCCSA